jgi:hypothetical protein
VAAAPAAHRFHFPPSAARAVKSAFYDGPVRKTELEAIAMPMLESYDVALTETTPGFIAEVSAVG